jgi:hypothetical protein
VIDPDALLADLQKQVKALEADLKTNEDDIAKLRVEYDQAYATHRTAVDFEATWLPERITQTAVAWVLATVFVRFCEDNGLIGDAFIAGPGERTAQARERQEAYFQAEANRHKTDREWLQEAFALMGKSQAAKSLFTEHNPMNSIAPSHDAAKALIDFWRKVGADGGLVHDFTDPEWNTRFLGNLYQDLSESARKTYALLQTPEFVEEFILKRTLDEAIKEFGLEPNPPYGHPELPHRLRVIDPACGSGHFLLGAFHHLLEAWKAEHPGADSRILVANALQSVHGADKNPFAVAIARFRVMLAAMNVADVKRLDERVDFPLYIAVGDSLLHGSGAPGIQGELEDQGKTFTYRIEDVNDFFKPPVEILCSGTYHVVVGNPPYITVKDPAENQNYRAYPSCYGVYALSVPFAERMFQLAIPSRADRLGAGYVGQITANSFMKREFGKRLIQEYFPKVDLTHVIDTSGAYIPGHGTPTVILLGRRRMARLSATVRTVMGVRGEPSEPSKPEEGSVWRAIEAQVDHPGSESEWVSVADLPHAQFDKFPWSLSGGGAKDLIALIERKTTRLEQAISKPVGRGFRVGADDAYLRPLRWAASSTELKPLLVGEVVRNWTAEPNDAILFPYSTEADLFQLQRKLWPWRHLLAERATFQGNMADADLQWWDYMQFTASAYAWSLSICFAFVATHNNFTLVRGGSVFNRSAPVIKLPEGETEDRHMALLGLLNSSAACFWLKQVSHNKGSQGINEGFKSQEWERFYEFTGKKLEQFPLPLVLPLDFGRQLDSLARQLSTVEPSAVCATGVPARTRLDDARVEHERIRGRMIALQEELDWDVYHRYGLLTDREAAELVAPPQSVPELQLGERAFEIVLARRIRDEGFGTQWFERHRSTPITEIPAHWPDEYKAVVERRIEIIEQNRNIGLIERPECKRRWQSELWGDKERKALTNWLLDRCEARELWFGGDGQPQPLTVNLLADQLRKDADVVSVARLLKNDPDADLTKVLAEIIADEHVPYLASLRYKAEGMVKRRQWEATWDLQRQEDATGERLDIPVPPKYKNTDFQKPSYWRNRGKLDVPKERFISYPKASPDSDDSLLLGWAGWDHREQAQALYALIEERQNTDGWGTDKVTPLIKGLAEVMPWVRQWHNEVDPAFGQSIADVLDGYLAAQCERHGITID